MTRTGEMGWPILRGFAVLLAFVPLLGGCRERPTGEATAGPGRLQVTDDLGRDVVLPGPASRIASLSPSNTELLFALGCGDRVVLRDLQSTHPPRVRRIPATSPFLLSAEHVAGYSPDLVLLSHADAGRVAALERVGLAVATFDPRTLKQLLANVRAVGRLCGAGGRAARLVERMQARVRRVERAIRGRPWPTVYVETDGSDPLKPWTAGRRSLVHHLLELAGGRNLMARLDRSFVQVNLEEILVGQPDVILIMNVGRGRQVGARAALAARPGWRTLRAVREGRVIEKIHADLLSRPGPRLVEGLEALAGALHPAAFARGNETTPGPPDRPGQPDRAR